MRASWKQRMSWMLMRQAWDSEIVSNADVRQRDNCFVARIRYLSVIILERSRLVLSGNARCPTSGFGNSKGKLLAE